MALSCAAFAAAFATTLVTTLVATNTARADVPSALVIARKSKAESDLSRVTTKVRDSLEELELVELLPPPALDLDAAQLAIDCSEETSECLGELATRMEARVVIVPSLKKGSGGLELRLLAFDRTSDEPPKVAMRKQAGSKLAATLLDAVPDMLREVLKQKVPEPAEPEAVEPESEPEPTAEPAAPAPEPETSPASPLPIGPIVLGASGVAVVIAGVVVGAIASSTEDDYAKRTIDTEQQAKAADEQRVAGEQQALVANVLLGVGAAAVVGAGVWYLLDQGQERSTAARSKSLASVRPMLTPTAAWLELSGTWEALP